MKRNLTDADVQAIVLALKESINVKALENIQELEPHECRFSEISVHDLWHSIEFFKNINEAKKRTSSLIWKTIVVCGVTGFLAFLWWAVVAKINQAAGG